MEDIPNVSAIIVADDDAMIRDVLRSRLTAIDQTVFLASNGTEAVELASRIKVRLIMLDLNMPRLNGLLACQRIRKMPHHADTPIVILTSTSGKHAQDAAVRVGATTFLTKPFRSAQLLHVLAQFLPIDEVTRTEINRGANRAAEIAASRVVPVVVTGSVGLATDSAMDRAKNLLTVLRR